MKWIKVGLFIFLSIQVKANVILPRFISNGMVLQRNSPIPIWGWAEAGEKVAVTFKGKTYLATTGTDNKWKIKLDKSKEGGPFELIIKGANVLKVEDILVGDVWFCSGQSNMEYELYKAAEKYPNEIANSDNDQIRHFLVKRNNSFVPLDDVESPKGWEKASPKTVPNFSAIAYFYALKLYNKYKVPIGLINASYGGTPAEAWMSETALVNYPNYYNRAQFFKVETSIDSVTKSDKKYQDTWYNEVKLNDLGEKEHWKNNTTNTSDWGTVSIPSFWQEVSLPNVKAGVVWYKYAFTLPKKYANQTAILRLGNIIMRDETYVNGTQVGTTSNKHAPRKYDIKKKILVEGENMITVKVLNEMGDAGFIRDKKYQLEIGDTVINLSGDWKYKLGVAVEPFKRDSLTKLFCEGTSLYNAMINPLVGYSIKGVIWYQGESN